MNRKNNIKKASKNILFTITIFVMMLVISFSFGSNFSTKAIYASDSLVGYSSYESVDKLRNPDFSSSVSESQNKNTTIPNWTRVSYSGLTLNDYHYGVVKANRIENANAEAKAWENFGIIETPGLYDTSNVNAKANNYLMLNSHNSSGRFGYNSTSFTLDASTFYKISVTAKTIKATQTIEATDTTDEITRTSDSKISIYLNGLSESDDSTNRFISETTNTTITNMSGETENLNAWKTFTFYIETSPYNSEKLTLGLWLGRDDKENDGASEIIANELGAAFFKEVEVLRMSENKYRNTLSDAVNSAHEKFNAINLNEDYLDVSSINPSFENGLSGWTELPKNNMPSNTYIATPSIRPFNNTAFDGKIANGPTTNNSTTSNNLALMLLNNTSSEIGVQSDAITIKQHGLYRLSIWSWSNSNFGSGGKISILNLRDNTTSDALTATTSISSTPNLFVNNWTEYSFYISGDALFDTEVAIQLLLRGTEGGETSNNSYVFFDDIRLQEINYSQFNKGSNLSNSKSYKMEKSTDAFNVNNSLFNGVMNENNEVEYPLTPTSWTASHSNESGVFGGVINTNQNHFARNRENYDGINYSENMLFNYEKSLETADQSNNVLLIRNNSSSKSLTFSSNQLSLSSNSYYKFVLDIYSVVENAGEGAEVSITSDGSVVHKWNNINTNGNWQSHEFFIKTSTTTLSLSINLTLSNAGFALFDNVFMQTSGEEEFNNSKIQNKTTLDLNNFDFKNQFIWNISEKNNRTGISDFGSTYNNSLVSNPTDAPTNNPSLYLSSVAYVSLKYTSNVTYNLSAYSYYKISVFVKTLGIATPDDDAEGGATFQVLYDNKLDGFENINTHDSLTGKSEFKEYIIYISPESEISATLMLALGNDEIQTSGTVFFNNLKITAFSSEDEMKADLEENEKNHNTVTKSIVAAVASQDPSSETEENDKWTFDPQIWSAATAIITSLAIIAAIVGVLVRKINWKRPVKIKTSYDRRVSLDKNITAKEKIQLRKDLIAQIKEEISNIDSKIEQLHSQFAEKVEEEKESTANTKTILLEELGTINSEKERIQSEINAKVAKNKKDFTKEDIEANKQIAALEKKAFAVDKKIVGLDKNITNLKFKRDQNVEKLNAEQSKLNKEIEEITGEINNINLELQKK